MARPLKFTETMLARFPEGTFERIKKVLSADGEDKASLVREAVERELKRRERPSPR